MPYYYTRDHLGSVREMTNTGQTIVARYEYDVYGRTTAVGTITTPSDFQYTGYYEHATSGLNFPMLRAGYDGNTGKFIQRDRMGEEGGVNLYDYVGNDPINEIDPLGLFGAGWQVSAGVEAGTVQGGGATVQGGSGAFVANNFSSSSLGGFVSGGSFSGSPGSNLQFPGGTSQTPWVVGAAGGIGQGVFFTNANTKNDLSGPFHQYNLNLFVASISVAYDPCSKSTNPLNWTWIASVSFLTRGLGLSVSSYSTTTKVSGP